MNRKRGTENVSQEEISAANENGGEGNNLSILSFRGAFHGRTIGCISCTNSKGDIKITVVLKVNAYSINSGEQLKNP